MIEVYTDGAYNPGLGQGSWTAVVVEGGQKRVFSDAVKGRATSQRMEIQAALEGLLQTQKDAEITIWTDSQYVVKCAKKEWQRRKNLDLWAKLDGAVGGRKVHWQWIESDSENPYHREAHELAERLAAGGGGEMTPQKAVPMLKDLPGSAAKIALTGMKSSRVLRIIDASLNRAGEGLRLLEDVARLMLDDTALTQQLKTMRHELIRADFPFHQRLLEARDSAADVGADLEVPGEEKERELPTVVVANARRVQESLRTLEELAKLPGAAPELDSERFKRARFNLYTIEQKLLAKLLRREKLERLSGLYVIVDTQLLKGRDCLEVARQVIRGGARIIQLRDKVQSKKDLLAIAQKLRALCAEHNVLFMMNDYLDLALATNADGLHLGQEDLPAKVARQLLPQDKILGCSARTIEEATSAQSDGADYLGVGAIYPTSTKETAEVVGLERLRQIKQAVVLPLVAIGGISRDNAAEVMAAGAVAVAVISAVVEADSPEEAAREIVARIEAKIERTDR